MKYAFVDYRISTEEFESLTNLNCKIIKCEPSSALYDAICGHPDILLHFINKNTVIIHKDTSTNFEALLKNLNLTVLRSEKTLEEKYPEDIILNGVNTTDFFMHTLANTDPLLLEKVHGKILINVKQGYTKCSTVVLNHKAFITSDKSIYTALTAKDYDVLLIEPGHIELPGLNYGFIGGTCGMSDPHTLVFYGSLEYHPHKENILTFLKKHNITPIYLFNGPLIDRGSIFFIDL